MVNFNPIDYDYIVMWQSDLENTKDWPLHKPSQDQSKSTALGGVWNFAERCIGIGSVPTRFILSPSKTTETGRRRVNHGQSMGNVCMLMELKRVRKTWASGSLKRAVPWHHLSAREAMMKLLISLTFPQWNKVLVGWHFLVTRLCSVGDAASIVERLWVVEC